MLTLRVGGTESFDETTSEFVKVGSFVTLEFEHSLLSVSKWESIFEKPFLTNDPKSPEELLTYIRCMVVTQDFPPEIFQQLSENDVTAINSYLESKQTATWFSDQPGAPKTNEIITSELIYYWMTAFTIPFECERWNLNRLFTLIRVCNNKQAKPKKMSRGEIARRNRELNAQRKEKLGTSG